MERLLGIGPPSFKRTELATGVNLYSADKGASNLIIGFTTRKARLMMPAFRMLDALDYAAHDVLLLTDSRRLHFDNGIEGYASSMPELMDKVGSIARRRGYRSIVTYGTSMGGFPALRGGDLLKADRAISAGGRFVWHPAMIARNDRVEAFDSICNCRMPLRTSCYLLYSDANVEDVEHAGIVAETVRQCRTIGLPCSDHNFPHQIQIRGKLPEYLREIFDLDKEPDEAKLSALLK